MPMTAPITQRRIEVKYAVPLDRVAAIESELRMIALPIEYVKGQPSTFVTTVYLDRPDLSLARAAILDPSANEKVRAREYYYHPEALVPSVWVEWKARRETWSDKRRFALSKDRFDAFLAGTLREDVVRMAQPTGGELAGVEAFRRVRTCARGLLVPRFAVTVRRRAFTISSPRIRLTLDTEARFHPVPSRPWLGAGALAASRLASPFYELPHAILEVKSASELPQALRALLRPLTRTSISKFVIGSRHLLSA